MINTEQWTKKFEYSFNIEYFILLILATLHYEEKITDAKLKGQFQALRKGTLQKKKRTYHCTLNDRWYNNETAHDIFSEVCEDMRPKKIPFKKFLEYIQLFEGANYNYALNVFGSKYLYPIFNSWDPEYHVKDFYNYADFAIPGVVISDYSHYCYECGTKHINISKNEEKNYKTINQWLHNQKKGNLTKIPFHKIENHQGWSFRQD